MIVTEAEVRQALRQVQDPDLKQDIETLGFIRHVVIDGGRVAFDVELTTPACPVKDALQDEAKRVVAALPGVEEVSVRMTARTRSTGAAQGAAALSGVKHVVLVGAGKGGVGKSTATLSLAHALRQAGARVGILDADVHGPSMVAMTGVEVPSEQGPGGMRPPEADGVAIVSMGQFVPAARPTLLRGPRVTALLRQLLTGFGWGELDYLLVDMPPGTSDVHLTLAQVAPVAGAVLVTTPQQVAVADTRRAATMFRTLEVPLLGVLETMSGFECPDCGSMHPIFGEGGGAALAQELDIPLLGRIPIDPQLVLGGERARPLQVTEPHAPASRAHAAAAGSLVRQLSILASKQGEALASFSLEWRDGD